MTLSEQTSVVLEAIDAGFLKPRDIERWAENALSSTTDPPYWLIELAINSSPRVADYESLLRKGKASPLPPRIKVQLAILACNAGAVSLQRTMVILFPTIFLTNDGPRDPRDADLIDALSWWDCQEGPDVLACPLGGKPRPSPLLDMCERAFEPYLADADAVRAVLPWKLGPGTETI